jgi:nucleoid-associated protein YgaU
VKPDLPPPPPPNRVVPPAAPEAPAATLQAPLPTPQAPGIRPAAGAVPQADAFDEDIHSCKEGDTYRTVSQQFYLTDRYEKALQRYNRDYPIDRRADPSVLQPGMRVRVPPIRVLVRKYGDLLGERQTVAPVGTLPVGPPPGPPAEPAPVRLAPPVTPPGQSTQAMASPAGATYVVGPGGETVWAVARNTLGSGQYWERIYRLNPSLNPQAVIPAGTRLRLPPEARVPPANQ